MVAERARRRFGQHFLSDDRTLDEMVSSVAPRSNDSLFEIGPGRGALTSRLIGTAGRLRAIEIDRDLVVELARRFPSLELLQGDVLSTELDVLLPPEVEWRVVGNLPYNISTPLLIRLLGALERVRDMHFLLQKEVVERLCAVPGTKAYGRLSIVVQLRCTIAPLFDVAPVHFRPPPKVHSTFVHIVPTEPPSSLVDSHALDTLLRIAFSGRRKTLRNALKSLELDWSLLDVDAGARPDQIGVSDYVALANQLAARGELAARGIGNPARTISSEESGR